jgi:hypothetical protein
MKQSSDLRIPNDVWTSIRAGEDLTTDQSWRMLLTEIDALGYESVEEARQAVENDTMLHTPLGYEVRDLLARFPDGKPLEACYGAELIWYWENTLNHSAKISIVSLIAELRDLYEYLDDPDLYDDATKHQLQDLGARAAFVALAEQDLYSTPIHTIKELATAILALFDADFSRWYE